MSDPQNQNIRGPNFTTLQDVFGQLSSIATGLASLPAIAANIEQIAGDLRRLSGSEPLSPAYTSLPAELATIAEFNTFLAQYLQLGLGYSTGTIPGNTLSDQMGRIATAIGVKGASDPNVLARLASLVTNTTGVPASLAGIQAATNSLQLVAGTLEETPNGETIKFILSELRDCCQGGSTPGGGTGTENPAPTGFCDTFTRVRVDAWQFVGTDTVSGNPVNVYRATWADNTLFNPLNVGTVSGSTLGLRTIYALTNTRALYCVSWDFTGNTLPVAIGRDLGTSPSIADSAFIDTPISGASSYTIGSIADELNRCGGASAQFSAVNFAFPTGVTPSRNVWLGVQALTCAS